MPVPVRGLRPGCPRQDGAGVEGLQRPVLALPWSVTVSDQCLISHVRRLMSGCFPQTSQIEVPLGERPCGRILRTCPLPPGSPSASITEPVFVGERLFAHRLHGVGGVCARVCERAPVGLLGAPKNLSFARH